MTINEMSDTQMKKREEIVKSMKKKGDFSKYGDRAKEVMYATATKLAMKEDLDPVIIAELIDTLNDRMEILLYEKKCKIAKGILKANAEQDISGNEALMDEAKKPCKEGCDCEDCGPNALDNEYSEELDEANWIHTNPSERGKYNGWSISDLEAAKEKLKAKHANGGETTEADKGKMAELEFAIRAKKGHGFQKEEFELDEARRIVIKVNAKGKRRKKIVCGKGKKLVGTSCKPITGGERQRKKIAVRKMKRTLKRRGSGAKRRSQRLRQRALMKRKSMGLRRK